MEKIQHDLKNQYLEKPLCSPNDPEYAAELKQCDEENKESKNYIWARHVVLSGCVRYVEEFLAVGYHLSNTSVCHALDSLSLPMVRWFADQDIQLWGRMRIDTHTNLGRTAADVRHNIHRAYLIMQFHRQRFPDEEPLTWNCSGALLFFNDRDTDIEIKHSIEQLGTYYKKYSTINNELHYMMRENCSIEVLDWAAKKLQWRGIPNDFSTILLVCTHNASLELWHQYRDWGLQHFPKQRDRIMAVTQCRT